MKSHLSKYYKKNKAYYIFSANKIIARFELAKIRIENIEIEEKNSRMIVIKLNNGIEWLNNLIQNIKNESDAHKFLKEVPYKEWHVIKLDTISCRRLYDNSIH